MAVIVPHVGQFREKYAYVDYAVEAEPWHERLVLCHITAQEYVVISPDFDMYVEDLREVEGCRISWGEEAVAGRRPALPEGLGAGAG